MHVMAKDKQPAYGKILKIWISGFAAMAFAVVLMVMSGQRKGTFLVLYPFMFGSFHVLILWETFLRKKKAAFWQIAIPSVIVLLFAVVAIILIYSEMNSMEGSAVSIVPGGIVGYLVWGIALTWGCFLQVKLDKLNERFDARPYGPQKHAD